MRRQALACVCGVCGLAAVGAVRLWPTHAQSTPAPPAPADPLVAQRDAEPVLIPVGCTTATDARATDAPKPRPTPAKAVVDWSSPAYLRELDAIMAALPHLSRSDVVKLGYFCPADFNKDDQVDAADVAAFMQAFSDPDSPLTGWTDFNQDGVIDQTDLQLFLDAYGQGGCDTQDRKNLRDVIC